MQPATLSDDALRGKAMMLLAAMLGGGVLGLITSRLVGGIYLTGVMPFAVGWGVGMLIAGLRMKFFVTERLPGLFAVIGGAALAYGVHHLASFARVAALLGEDGIELTFGTYLELVGTEEAGPLSPVGLLGRMGLGVTGTFIVAGLELVAAIGAAVWCLQSRSGHLDEAEPRPTHNEVRRVREIVARIDGETLEQAMTAMDNNDFEAAGKLLIGADGDEFAVLVAYAPYSQADYIVEVAELTPDGPGPVRAARNISSFHGQELLDEVRLGSNAAPSSSG